MVMDDRPHLAAIPFKKGSPVDALLARVAEQLQASGRDVAGLIQTDEPALGDCCGAMMVTDFDGTATVISQALGPSAKGCRLDSRALAEVAGRLDGRLDRGYDILIANRFGKAEAEGGGLRGLLERALAEDRPVLLAVREDFINDFKDFHDGLATILPADEAVVRTWAMTVTARIQPAEVL